MKNKNMITIAVIVLALGVVTYFTFFADNGNAENASLGGTAKSVTNANGDMEIPLAEISEVASFYAYDELDSEIEIIAVKASDGTIRTAFNTCQVCYSSGRGYYVQEGDNLICQNCGNAFRKDDLEVTRGGCNPVPIYDEYTEVTEDSIIIPKAFLEEAEVIFENWKL